MSSSSSQSSAQPAMNPALAEAMKPGPEHQQIGKVVGEWDVACTMWCQPGQPPEKSVGINTFTAKHDGRYVKGRYTGTFQGQPFTGHSTNGFDRAAKRYFTTWCDSMGTGFLYLTGTSADGGKTITYSGEMVCPISGPLFVRQVETHQSDDHFTTVMYQSPMGGGEESKSMELSYTRRR